MSPLAPTPHVMQLAGMGSRAIEDMSYESWSAVAGLGESILRAHPQLIMGVMSLGIGDPPGGGGEGAARGGGGGGGRNGVSSVVGRVAAGAAPRVRSARAALVSPRWRHLWKCYPLSSACCHAN